MKQSKSQKIDRLGRYRIVGRLGSGGMSTVYRAVADGSDQQVALKVTAIENDVEVDVSDYQREVMMGRRLQHPNIISPVDHGCRDGHIFLAMPIVEGATLSNSTRLRDPSRKPSSSRSSAYNDAWIVPMLEQQWDRIIEIGTQLAGALVACHQAGIIHRDIKPGNVIMDRDGQVYLMDFGLAWMKRGPVGLELETRDGTARYLPPEVFRGERDERSDVYSLGLTLHELTTGLKVWGDVDHETIRERRLDYRVPQIQVACPSVPQPLADCIDMAASDEPGDRHQSAQGLLEHFELLHKHQQRQNFSVPGVMPTTFSTSLSQLSQRPSVPIDESWFAVDSNGDN